MKDKYWFYWYRYLGKRLEWFVCLQAGPWWTLEFSLWLAGPILEVGLLFISVRLGRWRIDPTPLDVELSQAQVYTWQEASSADALTYTASGNKTAWESREVDA